MADEVIKKVKKEPKEVVLKKIEFFVGSYVYLKTDPFQLKRMVLNIHLGPLGYEYELRHSTDEPTIHYGIEISDEKGEVEQQEEDAE